MVASANLFRPLSDLTHPVFNRFDNSSAGVSYEGIGAILDEKNEFVFPILRAESTTISANKNGDVSSASGE